MLPSMIVGAPQGHSGSFGAARCQPLYDHYGDAAFILFGAEERSRIAG